MKITAQLIKAADGFHVWSDTFTRELKDVFAMQDEIAGLIAKNLQLTLGDVLASDRTSLRWSPAVDLQVESRSFEQACDRGEFERACALYRGDFLEGFSPGDSLVKGKICYDFPPNTTKVRVEFYIDSGYNKCPVPSHKSRDMSPCK